jgi:hypothetical protein
MSALLYKIDSIQYRPNIYVVIQTLSQNFKGSDFFVWSLHTQNFRMWKCCLYLDLTKLNWGIENTMKSFETYTASDN